MNVNEREMLVKEARMQLKALKKIDIWKKLAIAVSTFGVAAAYAGLAGASTHLLLGILGIILIIAGALAAMIFNLGLKNGRRNVEKIIHVIGEGGLS